MKYFMAFLCTLWLSSCGCNHCECPDFATVFEAYKWLGDNRQDERNSKIMNFLHNYNAETMITGVEYVSDTNHTETYNYIAFCNGANFKHLNFSPLSNNHSGIAYVNKVDEFCDDHMQDSLKFYFQDSIQAKAFVNESIKYGFEYVKYESYSFGDTYTDSINRITTQYATCYSDLPNGYVYSLRILSEKDKNVVILHYCP